MQNWQNWGVQRFRIERMRVQTLQANWELQRFRIGMCDRAIWSVELGDATVRNWVVKRCKLGG
jgi:hypothetical protein